MSQITEAIAARQTQITKLQSEIESLQRAAGILGPPAPAAAKPKPKSKATPAVRAKPTAAAKPKAKSAAKRQPKSKAKQKRKAHQWTAAEKAAIGKRMKAYWAKRRKAKE